MSVVSEEFKSLLAGLQETNRQTMAVLAQAQLEALREIVKGIAVNKTAGLTDGRGVGRPVSFKGEESKYQEWKAKLMAYLVSHNKGCNIWLKWAIENNEVILSDDVRSHWKSCPGEAEEFGNKLYAVLLSSVEGEAFHICHSAGDGNGYEALRLLAIGRMK